MWCENMRAISNRNLKKISASTFRIYLNFQPAENPHETLCCGLRIALVISNFAITQLFRKLWKTFNGMFVTGWRCADSMPLFIFELSHFTFRAARRSDGGNTCMNGDTFNAYGGGGVNSRFVTIIIWAAAVAAALLFRAPPARFTAHPLDCIAACALTIRFYTFLINNT